MIGKRLLPLALLLAVALPAFADTPRTVNAGVYFHRLGGENGYRFVVPFYWHWWNGDARGYLVAPYLRLADDNGSTDSLLPVYWRFFDVRTQALTTLLLPIAAWHDSPSVQAHLIGPFYSYRGSAGWARGLFPLLHFQNLEGRQRQLVLLAFYHSRLHTAEGVSDTGFVGPIFWRRHPDGAAGGVFPIAWASRHGDRRYGTLAGLFTLHRTAARTTGVLGPLYASGGRSGWAVGLAPLFHVGRSGEKHTAWLAPPLFVHHDAPGQGFTLLGPLFRDRDGKNLTQGLFPIAWWIDRPPRRYRVLLPLFARATDAHRDDLWVGPYLRLRHDQATTHVVLPLLAKHDAPDRHVFVQFPFFWRVREGAATDTVVFPFYWRARRPGFGADVAFPLVWRFRAAQALTTVVGPLYVRQRDERTHAGLLPLFGFGRAPSSRYVWALPAFFHQSDTRAGTSRTLAALFYWDRRPDGWTGALPPFYIGWRRGPTTRVVGPIFYHTYQRERGSSFNLIGPAFAERRPDGWRGGLVPLLFMSGRPGGHRSVTLLPLLHVARRPDASRVVTPLFGWWRSRSQNDLRGFAGPFYFRSGPSARAFSLLPIFFWSTAGAPGARRSSTALLPLFFHRSTPESSLTAVTPLVWRHRGVETSTTLGLPLFFDHHSFFASRTSGFLPLYVRHVNWIERSTAQVLPLLYLKRAPTGSALVLFPLLWRFAPQGGLRSTIVFPLVWDFRRASPAVSLTQLVLPLFARVDRPFDRYRVMLNTYYHGFSRPDGDGYHFYFIPLFDFGRRRPHDVEWNLLHGLVGYSRIGGARSLRLFYFGEIGLGVSSPAASAPTGTFFTSSPSLRGDPIF